jgi:hypothetical protein
LLFHEVGEDAGVGGEAGEGEAEMLVDGDDFFLVRGEFFCVSLGGRLVGCGWRWGEGLREG